MKKQYHALFLQAYLAAANATVVLLVVDNAELSRRNAMYWRIGINAENAVTLADYGGWQIVGSMAYLERYALHWHLAGKEMEVVDMKCLLVCRLGIVALADVKNVFRHVFPYRKPWTFAKTETLALANGVEPQTLMLPQTPSCLQLNDVAGILAEIAAQIVVVVNLA